jgi:serine/threonine protein kinase
MLASAVAAEDVPDEGWGAAESRSPSAQRADSCGIAPPGELSLEMLLLENGYLPDREALRVTLKICDALRLTHAQGNSHGDISAENIFFNRDGRVRIGNSGGTSPSHSESADLPSLGFLLHALIGTPQIPTRRIISRTRPDAKDGYHTLRDFVRDLNRETRLRVLRAASPIILLGLALLSIARLLEYVFPK